MNNSSIRNQNILTAGLFQLCAKQKTGTVFILTEQKISAQFVLKDGMNTAFSFDKKHGLEAIEEFKNASYDKYHFVEDYEFPLTKESSLKDSNEVLSELGFNEYLMERNAERKERLNFKCLRPEFFKISTLSLT